jgi:hypothetical protein
MTDTVKTVVKPLDVKAIAATALAVKGAGVAPASETYAGMKAVLVTELARDWSGHLKSSVDLGKRILRLAATWTNERAPAGSDTTCSARSISQAQFVTWQKAEGIGYGYESAIRLARQYFVADKRKLASEFMASTDSQAAQSLLASKAVKAVSVPKTPLQRCDDAAIALDTVTRGIHVLHILDTLQDDSLATIAESVASIQAKRSSDKATLATIASKVTIMA